MREQTTEMDLWLCKMLDFSLSGLVCYTLTSLCFVLRKVACN